MSTDQQSKTSTSKADIDSVDNEDLNKHRRLKAIHNAREEVVDARRRVDDAHLKGLIGKPMANTILRREIESYIHEVEWLMENADTDRDYWAGVDLGTMMFPDGSSFKFVGLQAITEFGDPIKYRWETEENDEWDGRQVQTHHETLQIPRDVLMSAFRAVNGFLFEIGLDLSLNEGEDEFGFEYAHLAPGVEEDSE